MKKNSGQAKAGNGAKSSKPRKKKASADVSAGSKKRKPAATRKKPPGNAREPSRKEIALRAYDIWERNGRPEGDALDNWVRAEKELRDETG
jgi:hypothetical protein